LTLSGVIRTFDYTHFRALHFHLFQDLYDWAGAERDVVIAKGSSRFAGPLFIRDQACHILRELRHELTALQHIWALPVVLSHFINEMNVVHAFREGNGRHLREFVRQVLEELGCGVNAAALRRERWIPAVVAGFGGDEQPMAALLTEIIVPPATHREHLFAPIPEKERRRFCASLKRSGYPQDIVHEYRVTLHC